MKYLLLFLPLLLLWSCERPPADLEAARERIRALELAAHADSLRNAAVRDSLRDGMHQYHDKNGRLLMEGELRGAKRQGIWTSYGATGSVKSRSEYVDGVLNGSTTVFRENGQQYYVGTNYNGKPFGEWKFYDEQGMLARTLHYDSTGTVMNDR